MHQQDPARIKQTEPARESVFCKLPPTLPPSSLSNMDRPDSSLAPPCSRCGFVKTVNDYPLLPPLSITNPLLRHNEPLEDSELPAIIDFLARERERVESLDRQIAILTQERDVLAQDIRAHAGVVSTLRRLPTEILRRIFSMTLHRRPVAYMGFPQTPWYLGQICKRWRDVAIALPSLWSSFGVHTSKRNFREFRRPDESPRTLERFQEQFRRSGEAPLQVTIDGDFSMIPGALDTLRDACGRWETLSVRMTSYYLDEIRNRTPMLRRMCVAAVDKDRGPQIAFEFSSALSADLYNLATCCTMDPLISFRYVDWAHLTRYDGPVLWWSYLDLLRQATSLVECRLFFDKTVPRQPLGDDIVSLPSLRRLYVSTTHCLTNVVAPGLEEFAVGGHGLYYDPGPDAYLIDFLNRSSCTLLRLSLFDFPATLALFQAVPSLQELTTEFHDRDLMTSLLENMLPNEEGGNDTRILANLTAISIGDMARLPLSLTVKAISARFGSGLQDNNDDHRGVRFFGMLVDISSDHPQTRFLRTEATKQLAALQRAGLEFCVLKTRAKYDRLRMTDPYSMQRYAEYHYAESATSGIWEF